MTDQETRELKIARYIVGGVVFFAVWWIWNALEISVLAVQSTNPALSATGFSLSVIGTEILGPALLAIGFVVSGAGKLVLSFAANVVARFDQPANSAKSMPTTFTATTERNFRKIESRLVAIEKTVASWGEPSE